jgi:hypothetical protein
MENPVTIQTHPVPIRISNKVLPTSAKSLTSKATVNRIIPQEVAKRDLYIIFGSVEFRFTLIF